MATSGRAATAHTSRKLEDVQRLVDRRQLATFQDSRPDGFGVGICHLGDGRLLFHGLDHVPESLDALAHLGPRIFAHDFLEEVVGKDGVGRQGGFALDNCTGGRLAVAPVVPVRGDLACRAG